MWVEKASMIGCMISVDLFGIYTTMTIMAMVFVKRKQNVSRLVPGVMLVVWLVTLVNTAFQIHGLSILVTEKVKTQMEFFHRTYIVVTTTLHFFSISLSDALICWRLYVIWNRRKVVLIVPLLLLLGSTVSGFWICTVFIIASVREVLPIKDVEAWVLVPTSLIMALHILVTSLACWKIWHVGRGMGLSKHRFHATLHALIESGGLYFAARIICMVARLAKLEGVSIIMSYLLPQVVGIAPTWILIRLHFPTTQPQNNILA